MTSSNPRVLNQTESTEQPPTPSWNGFGSGAKLTIERYLQDLHDAETPSSPVTHKYHTGRLPNGKVGDNKPRLLLMGQRRYA